MAGDSGSKTEKPTAKKRRDQRKEGNVFQSKDVVTVLTLFGSFYILRMMFPKIYETVRAFLIQFLELTGTISDINGGQMSGVPMMVVKALVATILPVLLASVALSIIGTGIQTKFLFSRKSVSPQFNRLNPLSGIKKLFSLQNVVELIKSILKIIILVAVIYNIVIDDMVQVVRTMDMDILMSGVFMLNMVMTLVFRICLAFIVIAALDFMYQWWDYERKLKMTKQEVKEEYKQTEGDPKIKSRIRNIQMQRARERMMQSVPGADVVIRNPTHFAVALKYDADAGYNAPVVVAKGQDELALRIVKVAEENGVAVVENPPLARGIYATTDLSGEIPQEYYGAVAEVLVYVYKMNNKME
ncbi:MAG: flagellar biosynthesis protein FlhB [Dorea sp.]|nr:flagellar biosynthesis protein FlhB [Dorea sp.]